MKRYFLCLLFLCMAAHDMAAQEHASRVTLIPGIPLAGQPVEIIYDPVGGPLDGQAEVKTTLHMFNDYRWQTRELATVREGNVYTVKYDLPGDCAFIALGFAGRAGDNAATDNNDDRGFVYMVNSPEGHYMPGTALAWGIFRKPSLGKGVYGYFKDFNISDDAAMMWIFREAQTYGHNMPKFFDSFLAAVRLASEEEFPMAVDEIVPQFLSMPETTEKSYMQVRDIYRRELKNEAKADSIETIILEKWPRGETARFLAHRNATQNMTVEKLERFLEDFPLAEWRQHPEQANQEFIYYNTYRSLITALIGNREYNKARSYADEMYFKALSETYRWNIEGQLKNPTLDFTPLYPVADAYIKQMILKVGDGTVSDMYGRTISGQNQLNARLSAHIRLLDRLGRHEEALGFLQYMSPDKRYSDPDLNEAYMNALGHAGTQAQVKEFLEDAVTANAATPAMIEKLKGIYAEERGSDSGFQAYFDSLKSAESLAEIRREMLAHIIDVPYEHFSLEDSKGNTVNSADWGGKVVILDFWGTWCYPCIRSFPGMQMAVDKFADDPHVGFYFVSTEDSLDNVERFIARDQYTFTYLYDIETGRNKTPNAVYKYFKELLGVTGVPCKIAIRDGRVRYVSVGYGGSPSKLADELTILIEILKEL